MSTAALPSGTEEISSVALGRVLRRWLSDEVQRHLTSIAVNLERAGLHQVAADYMAMAVWRAAEAELITDRQEGSSVGRWRKAWHALLSAASGRP